MGWNDHVDLVETECLDCGVIATWERWDAIALVRYAGVLGQKLGHDAERNGRCPHCGSRNGERL